MFTMVLEDVVWIAGTIINNEDIARAKRLGLNPKSLIKNIPSKSEPWKAPVKDWLIKIEEERLRKSEQKKKRKAAAAKKAANQSE